MIVSSGYMKYGLDAFGGKFLRKSDLAYWINRPECKGTRGVCFEMSEDVQRVQKGFFELIPALEELRIRNPECRISLTAEEERIFRENYVLIRGLFDSSAERFAKEHDLTFLHLDTFLAKAGQYYDDRGIDIIRLRFHEDGRAYIHQDCRCPGISAGNDGGGEVSFDLPEDFYKTMSARDVAALCWGTCYDAIISNGILESLITKARAKNGFILR